MLLDPAHMSRAGVVTALAALSFAWLLPACDNPVSDPVPPDTPCARVVDFLHNVAVVRPPGIVLGVAVGPAHIYAAAGTGGVHVFATDLDGTALPVIPIADARAVDLDGDILYVAAGDGGLVLVDVSNPAAASIRGTAALPGRTVDVDATGARAYVANQDVGMVVVDVSDPNAPDVRGIENTPGEAVAVAARESLVFVADRVNGLRIINASDADAPYLIKAVGVPGAARDVAVSGNTVLVAAGGGDLQLVDVTHPGFASIVGAYPFPRDVTRVAVSNNTAFVGVGSAGIRVVDITHPESPRDMQGIGTAGIVRDLAVYGRGLAVADDNAGARAMEINRPTSPAVETYLSGGDVRAVQMLGDVLVVGDASFGVRVFDPERKVLVAELAVSGGVHAFALADSILYGVNQGAVPVVDLHDPAQPVALSPVPAVGAFDDVAVAGDFLYLLAGGGELVERRLDGTGVPRTLSFFGPYFPSLTIEETNIYLPDRRGNVYIVPTTSLRTASIVPVGASAERVVFRSTDGPFGPVRRGWVLESGLVNGQAGAEVYDFSNIIMPSRTRAVPVAGNAIDAALTARAMVVAEGDDGWEVLLLDETTGTPFPVGYFPEPAWRVVALDDAFRFAVAAGPIGLLLPRVDACYRAR